MRTTTSAGTGATPRPGSTAGSPALKSIDQAALQSMVDTTAQELMIPGAVVLVRTPQGEFTATMGYDPTNQVTLVVWTNLAVAPDGQQPANTLMLKLLDQIYEVSPLSPSPTATP